MNKPKSEIYSDGMCVYVSVNLSNPFVGKLALVLANLLLLAVIGIAIAWWIPAMLLCFLALFLLLLKYSLWNFFGRENLIINTRSVSYQHHYGLLKTGYITKKMPNRLIVSNSAYEAYPGCVICGFGSYHEINHIPIEVYSMTFPIAEADARHLNKLIQKLFIDEMSERYDLPAIILN
jgi:hypothetical protein